MSHTELDDVLGKGWRKPPFVKNAMLRWALIVGFVAYLIAAILTIEVDWVGFMKGWIAAGPLCSPSPAPILYHAGAISGAVCWKALS